MFCRPTRRFLFFLLGLCLFVAIERFCHKQTRGFRLHKIASNSPVALEDELAHWSQEQRDELDGILDQPFTFLKSGGQSYAFLSEDKATIIKFFKHHHIRMWKWIEALPLPVMLDPYRKRLLDKKRHQSPQFFESCRIAYGDFRERSGLLYLHLHKTHSLNKKLQILDPLGIAHFIDLDTTDFSVQKRASLAHQTLRQHIKEQNLDAAKKCIDSLLSLMMERQQKGIKDRDPNIRRNIGFLGTHAIEIDLGSFSKVPKEQPSECNKEEIYKITRALHRLLTQQNPELSLYLDKQITNLFLGESHGKISDP